MKFFKNWKVILVILVILSIPIYYYGFTYQSEGDKTGHIVDISRHGRINKSWEGILQLGDQGSNQWHFSVSDDKILNQLKAASDNGVRVRLHYTEIRFNIGSTETNFIVTEVHELPK